MRFHWQSFLFTGFALFSTGLFAERLPGRYIVELNTESVSEHVFHSSSRSGMQSTVARAHRTRVRDEQTQVRGRLEQKQAVVLGSVDTVANAMFVRISDADAAQLASTPGVKRVIPVRMMHMILDRAVALHKVTDVWNEIGMDRAGAGIKIAIIDSGVDSTRPGFQDSSLSVPATYPRVNSSSDTAYTNNKIIVARSYVNLLPYRDPDNSARDHVGHGTALAMVAAGVRNDGPLASITGVAPKAFIGNYKVFGTPGYNDYASDDAILKAIDDAVADGMDVINLSLGSDLSPRLSDDLDVQAVERASKAGVIVVVAAGNSGPDLNTISSPSSAPSAIAVGATSNDRTFASSATVAGLPPFIAVSGDGVVPSDAVSGAIVDVAALDTTGLACSSLPANSLKNSVALILRGSCSFQIKLNNAQSAGAIAALVYAAQDSPQTIHMSVGTSTLPAEMIDYADGAAIKQTLAGSSGSTATLQFTLTLVPVPANVVTDFSAAGPNVDVSIKPDLMAVGQDIYVATQTLDSNGEMYDPSGYILVDGTSFSTPLVAGAAALIKGARPGLTVDQYRSLLINSASAIQAADGQTLSVQQTGAGVLNAYAAFHSTATAYPTSVSFGAGTTDAQISRSIKITNVGQSDETFSISAVPSAAGGSPSVGMNSVQLAAGASIDVPVNWNAGGLAAGTYEGVLSIAGSSGSRTRVPYWYAVPSGVAAHVTVLDSISSGRRRSTQRDAVLFRITDVSGLSMADAKPQASVASGGGSIRGIVSHDDEVPGMFGLDVQLGNTAGQNVFVIQMGDVSVQVSIAGT
ncbi:MAG: S8 family serine peptidase [Bryobacteraceae bacterium]